MALSEVALLFGTRVAETILASAHGRAHQQAGHMDASDLIKTLQKTLRGGGHIWGSGGNGGWRECVIGWMEFLSEFGTERTVVDCAPNLKQQVRAAS